MKEYNPKIEDEGIADCPCWIEQAFYCVALRKFCPDNDTGYIPTDCPARGEGILIKVKE